MWALTASRSDREGRAATLLGDLSALENEQGRDPRMLNWPAELVFSSTFKFHDFNLSA